MTRPEYKCPLASGSYWTFPPKMGSNFPFIILAPLPSFVMSPTVRLLEIRTEIRLPNLFDTHGAGEGYWEDHEPPTRGAGIPIFVQQCPQQQ